MLKRKICVITGSRAEYGHLYWLMKEIGRDKGLKLQIVATGAHLLPRFGLTFRLIEKDGFKIDAKVDICPREDSEWTIARSISRGLIKFTQVFKKLTPDIIVILGDRYEVFSAAIAAYILKIPIAHIHGGELTCGVLDEGFRHSISKMAQIHFPATADYAQRLMRMGESPSEVFSYGALAIDNLKRLNLLSKEDLEKSLGFRLIKPTAIVTYHPVTLEKNTAVRQMDKLLRAISHFDMRVIFTMPNADTGFKAIFDKIKEFVRNNRNKAKAFVCLGQLHYLSLLKFVDLMIGNSSSGLIEAPSFGLPVLNLGDRQRGRIRANNVIDCGYSELSIEKSISKALSPKFKRSLKGIKNPYAGDGDTAIKIKNRLKQVKLDERLIKKEFFDNA